MADTDGSSAGVSSPVVTVRGLYRKLTDCDCHDSGGRSAALPGRGALLGGPIVGPKFLGYRLAPSPSPSPPRSRSRSRSSSRSRFSRRVARKSTRKRWIGHEAPTGRDEKHAVCARYRSLSLLIGFPSSYPAIRIAPFVAGRIIRR